LNKKDNEGNSKVESEKSKEDDICYFTTEVHSIFLTFDFSLLTFNLSLPLYKLSGMKQQGWKMMVFLGVLVLISQLADAQCSICTKTASQLGEGPAKALNSAIIYLAGAPLAIMGYIGWRWWKREQDVIKSEEQTSTKG
jgi:hypothetical protein